MWLATWAARSRVRRITELAPPLRINRHPNPWVLSLRWYVNLFLQTSIWETITVRIGLKSSSVGYTIMGKTADLTVVQRRPLTPCTRRARHKRSLQKRLAVHRAVSKHINREAKGRKRCGRKKCTSNRDNRTLERIVKQNPFKMWGRFTKSGLQLDQEPLRTDVCKTWVSAVAFLVSSHSWTTDSVRSVSPGLKTKRTGLLLSGPKLCSLMKVNFAFPLEIRVPEFGGREERHRIHVAWGPV